VTKLTFSSNERTFSEFVIESADNVIVSLRNPVGMVDEIQYIGDGVFRVQYAPKISGLYPLPSRSMEITCGQTF
jgi:hypothetical protein